MMDELKLVRKMYIWLGIDLLHGSSKNNTWKTLSGLKNLSFPFFLLLNVIIIQLLKKNKFQTTDLVKFEKSLDFVIILLPCALWWSLYRRKNAIRFLIQSISKMKENYELKINLKFFISGVIIYCCILIFFSSITCGCVLERRLIYHYKNENFADSNTSIRKKIVCEWRKLTREIFLHIQELLMLFFFSVLYFAICYNFIKIFKFYNRRINGQIGCCDKETLRAILIEFIKVVKYTEKFADIFSLPLLWFSWLEICVILLLFLDILFFKVATYLITMYVFFMAISLSGIVTVLSFSADEIIVSINEFKKSLYDIKTERQLKNNQELSNVIDIVLNRETVTITVFRIMNFDRCFLFKVIATIIAHSVIYHQLTGQSSEL